jgi:Zn-dependent protease with chaperone function
MPGAGALLAYWLPYPLSSVGAAAGAYVGTVIAGHVIDRTVYPSWSFRSWLAFAGSLLLQSALGWAMLVAGILLMPRPLDASAGLIVGAYLVLNLALASGPLNLLWRRLHYVRPASPRLASIVAEASAATGVPVRAAWELDIPVQNAAALVMTRELAFTRALIAHHDDDAIRAICLHELAHLTEPRWTTILRAAIGPICNTPFLFVLPILDQSPIGVVLLWLLSILMRRGFGLVSVRFEKLADRYAMKHTPDPVVYARALERMYESNQMPVVFSARAARTHPDHYDRMIAAGIAPEYPKPEPPESHTSLGLALQLIVGVAFGIFLSMQN